MPDREGTPRALEGISVLDLGTFIGGPFCSTLLAEFGADVIKVEQPGVGDPMRLAGGPAAMWNGINLWWMQESRNKKNITCDLRDPRGQELMRRLSAGVDVVVENYTPGTLAKWNLDYDDLCQVNPSLIMVKVSGFGQSGPKKHRPGFARVAQAYGGLTYLTGEPGGPPLTPGSTSIADYISGLFGAFGALVALEYRERTGEGQVVELGLYESIFRIMDTLTVAYAKHGEVRDRLGRFTPLVAPHGQYPTKDGRWISLALNTDRQFRQFVEAMGRPELADDPRFRTWTDRSANRDVLNAVVDELTAQQTFAELMDVLETHDLPGGPVASIEDIFEDPHYWERGTLVRVQDEAVGELVVPAPIPHLSRTPARIEFLGAAEIGRYNEEVYCGMLGLSREQLAELEAAGVV